MRIGTPPRPSAPAAAAKPAKTEGAAHLAAAKMPLVESSFEAVLGTAAKLVTGDHQSQVAQLGQELSTLRREKAALARTVDTLEREAAAGDPSAQARLPAAREELAHLEQTISQVEQQLAALEQPAQAPLAPKGATADQSPAAALLRGKPISG